MGTNCTPLLADLFLYSYEAYFIQGILKKNGKKLARSLNFTSTNSGKSYQLRDIYSMCRCFWNVATYKWKVHNEKIEIISYHDLVEMFHTLIVIYQPLPRMDCIFHISHTTLELAVFADFSKCNRLLRIKLLNQEFLKNRFILSFKKVFDTKSWWRL
jgi:hypothetical protein